MDFYGNHECLFCPPNSNIFGGLGVHSNITTDSQGISKKTERPEREPLDFSAAGHLDERSYDYGLNQ